MNTKTKCKAFNDNCINTKTIFPSDLKELNGKI